MKYFILTLTALILSISTHGQKLVKTFYDPWSETKIKEKYTVDRENRKHGKYAKFDQRGMVAVEVNYIHGKPNGVAKEYFLPAYGFAGDEKVKLVAHYVDGSKHGTVKRYVYLSDGKEDLSEGKRFLQIQWEYNNDNIEREQKWWYNGHKQYDVHAIDGKCTYWYENGNKERESFLKEGKDDGPVKEWYSDGTIKEIANYSNGKLNGEKRYYYETGELRTVENYDDGQLNGQAIKYLKNGNKVIESNYVEGAFTGEYKKWYENGDLQMSGVIDNGKKQGLWYYYDKKGNEIYGEYRKGEKIGSWQVYYIADGNETLEVDSASYYRKIVYLENEIPDTTRKTYDYFMNGNKKFEGWVVSEHPDIFNKFCVFFYNNGRKKSEGKLIMGQQVGKWKEYYENGNIKKIYYIEKESAEQNQSPRMMMVGGDSRSPESSVRFRPSGYSFYYDEKGINTKTEYYSNGELMRTFDGKKSIKLELKYRDNPNQTRLF